MLKPFLHIDGARASVSPMSLVFGDTLDIDFEVDLHGGQLEGSYEQGTEHYALNWTSTALDVTGLPLDIPGMFDLTGRGSLITNGNMRRYVGQVKRIPAIFPLISPTYSRTNSLFSSQAELMRMWKTPLSQRPPCLETFRAAN